MFLTIKKKSIIWCLAILLVAIILSSFFVAKNVVAKPMQHYSVVIDAGHGGLDGGCVGKSTGVYESDLNLKFAYNLQKQLSNFGISCTLTRKTTDGLYDINAKNHKKSEMSVRKKIIDDTSPNLVISLHMNSYPLQSCQGAQTFYKKDNEQSKILANNIQEELCTLTNTKSSQGKVGDYYIVNCTNIPSVLVECGFLSNIEEEKLLVTTTYQTKICYAISVGIIKFLEQ